MTYTITDEELSCYLDGEVSPNERQRIETALERNPELQERLKYFSQADQLWKETIIGHDESKIPPAILNMLEGEEVLPANDNKAFWRVPVAASLAFVLGLTVQSFFKSNSDEFDVDILAGEINRDTPVYAMLENIPSAERVRLGKSGNLTITPVLTFSTNGGNFCREFIVSGTASATRNVACRGNENWSVIITSRTRVSSENQYKTVGADADQAVDLLIDSIIDGIPLDSEAEKNLLDGSWKKNN